MYELLVPKEASNDTPSLDPLWKKEGRFHIEYTMSQNDPTKNQKNAAGVVSDTYLGMISNLSYGDFHGFSITFNLTSQENYKRLDSTKQPLYTPLRNKQWYQIMYGEAKLFLLAKIFYEGEYSMQCKQNCDRFRMQEKSIPLLQYIPLQATKNVTKLLSKYHPFFEDKTTQNNTRKRADYYPWHWKPSFTLQLVTDFKRFSLISIPPLIYENAQMHKIDEQYAYSPNIYLFKKRDDELISLNTLPDELSLSINFEPLSYTKWQFRMLIDQALGKQNTIVKMKDKDTEDMHAMFTETNPYLLLVTLVVSLLHILFDWLAFKSDIQFWRKNKSLVGISIKSMYLTLMSQSIIFLYLMDDETSLLILVPSGISIIIQIWKIYKATGVEIRFSTYPWFIQFHCTRLEKEKANTQETSAVDDITINYMSSALYPLCIGYAVYSLIYQDQKGWYSWIIASLTRTVYAFGFILMTPQLFINYRLKSVAHLPWRFLVYRALNTFIDDLFAFIMPMPMMHRLSCFRDDIVFLIYLYQKWIYPIDHSRNNVEDKEEHEHTE